MYYSTKILDKLITNDTIDIIFFINDIRDGIINNIDIITKKYKIGVIKNNKGKFLSNIILSSVVDYNFLNIKYILRVYNISNDILFDSIKDDILDLKYESDNNHLILSLINKEQDRCLKINKIKNKIK